MNYLLRYSLISIFLIFFSANDVFAQVDLKLSPLGSFLPVKDLVLAEYIPHRRVGIELKTELERRETKDKWFITTMSLVIDPRFYIFPKNQAERLYVAPWIKYSRANYKSFDNALWIYNCNYFSTGLLIGYKHVWDSGVLLDFHIGGGHIFSQQFKFSEEMPEWQQEFIIGTADLLVTPEGILPDASVTLSVGYRLFRKEEKARN